MVRIGKAIVGAFRSEDATVHTIDIQPEEWFVGEVGNKESLESFAREVIRESGLVDYLVNNPLPIMKGINECSYEDFMYEQRVGVAAPFYQTKLLMPAFSEEAVVVNISSSG